MPQTSKIRRALFTVLRVFLYILMLLFLVYGILTASLGFAEQHRIREAAQSGHAITVEISEIQQLDGQIIVVMEPADGSDPHIGRTISTTTNRHLREGDQLTMYYGDKDPTNRVVDFRTARPMIRTGSILTAGSLVCCAVTGIVHLRLHRRKK